MFPYSLVLIEIFSIVADVFVVDHCHLISEYSTKMEQ